MRFAVLVKHGTGWLQYTYEDKRDQVRHAAQWAARGYTVKTKEIVPA